ncbi:MAG: TonB family protein [Candidatus Manganitrophus sp.]|nr:MAG: TonB family protein [Candidatus Manganitrophus sp.]
MDRVVAPTIAFFLHLMVFFWIGPLLSKANVAKPVQMIQFEMVPPKIQVTQTASGPPQGDREEAPKPGGIQEKPGVISTLPKGKPKAPPVEKLQKQLPLAPPPVEEIKPVAPEESSMVSAEPADAVSSMPMIEEAQGITSGEEGTAETSVSEGPGVADGSDDPGIVGGTGGLGFPGGTGTAPIGSSLVPLILGPISPGMPDYDGLGRFRNAAFKQIQRHQHYPKRARDRGIEGVINVQFTIDQNGKVHEVTVLPSEEAHPLLAQAAMETIRKASPLPRVPDLLKGHDRIVLTLGMRFELK